MANEITPSKNQPPANLLAKFAKLPANIRTGVSVPTLSFKNKVWQLRDGDETRPLMVEVDGEMQPSSFVDVVIVGKNPERSRVFYAHAFDPDNNEPPTCAASDGIKPDADIKTPQAPTCAVCPNNVVGSKMAKDGVTPLRACGSFQRLAVIPANDLNFKPSLLSVRGQSLYDPDNKEAEKIGKYAFSNYERTLIRDGISNLAMVVTRISFDLRPEVDGVKLLFKRRDGWLNEEQVEKVVEVAMSQQVDDLVSGKFPGSNRGPGDSGEEFAPVPPTPPVPAPALVKPQFTPEPQPAAKAAPVQAANEPVSDPKPVAATKPPAARKSSPRLAPTAPDAAQGTTTEESIEERIKAAVAQQVAEQMAAMQASKASINGSGATEPVPVPEGDQDEEDKLEKALGNWDKF